MAVLCRFRAILQSRKSKKMGRGGSPSGPKPQARTRRLPKTQILPQRRRDAEEGILGILGILPRRAEIRVSQGLTRRHEATKKIRCSNGSPLPFGDSPRMPEYGRESKKQGRVASPRGPKLQARMRRLPPTQILPQSRRAEKNCSRPTQLGRRFPASLYIVLICECVGPLFHAQDDRDYLSRGSRDSALKRFGELGAVKNGIGF